MGKGSIGGWKKLWLVSAGLLLASAASRAQQAPAQRAQNAQTPVYPEALQSDLTRDNYDRVAAAPGQIKEVLIKDPGLMVELKRWMAKEASDTGRVVSDEELTDTAVFDRLANDVKFRSVATRLLQRYGYLRPMLNPESELGKEQDLLIKERVRRIAQLEEREEPRPAGPETKTAATSKGVPCAAPEDIDCAPQVPVRPKGLINDGSVPQGQQPGWNAPNEQEQPPPTNKRVLQAQGDLDTGSLGQLTDNSATLLSVSSPSRMPNELNPYGSRPPDMLNANPTEQPMDSTRRSGTSDATLPETGFSRETANEKSAGIFVAPEPRLGRNRDTLPESMTRKPNPYADIPSLYDLYVQAPARDLPPQRFGTNVFRDGLRDPRSLPMDLPVGPDYVVGPGDMLSIDLWGGISAKLTRLVDRQGRVTLPEAGPVLVSGHSLGEVQQSVQKAMATQYRDTSADVSVARLRTVRVYVVGEVEQPGAYDISSLSTALNALVAAGGVTRQGSLRALRHMRGHQELEEIDAYDLLLRGVSPDASRLENGDTLMVPPVGPQVTVTGMVRRPAIYELHGETGVAEVLALAGGILPAAALQHVEVQRLEAHEKRTMLSLDLSLDRAADPQLASFKVQDGDSIHIFPIAAYNQDTIYLRGHVLRPGRYSYKDGMKVTDLIDGYKDLLPEPAAHYAEIIRLNPPDFRPNVVSFDLSAAMKDPATAPVLKPLDTVRVFSRFDFEAAPTVTVAGEVRKPGTFRTSGQASLRDAVYQAGGLTPDAARDTAQLFRVNPDGSSRIFSVNLGEALGGDPDANISLEPRDLLLIHKNTSRVDAVTVEIQGEVAKPGRYPFTENMHVEDLIRAAGGLKVSADRNTADLTRYAASGGAREQLQISLTSLTNGNPTEDVPLRSGDVLSIRQLPGWNDISASVKVSGEVMHPSTYGIEPGERLSSVLERAGGYTPLAYPYGAVLMRREVRDLEAKSQQELIARMKAERDQLKTLPEGDTDQKNAKLNAIAQTDAQLSQLATNVPIGRVVIHIDKNLKEWKNTPADIALRDGDILVIPKQANVVMVNGQVFNPTAISAQPGRSAKWYLSQAGGLTPLADKKAVFVVRADGSVISAKNNNDDWLAGNPLDAPLRAGDSIVVPERTPKIGGVNWTTIMQTAQVASSVALAVAYIHP